MKLSTLHILSTAFLCMLLSSCRFFGGENIAMTSDEAIAKIQEFIKSNIDLTNNKIVTIKWEEESGDRKLENRLAKISVYYIDKEGNSYSQTCELNDKGKYEVGTPEKSSTQYSYDVAIGINPDELNSDKIHQQITESEALIDSEYESVSVDSYKIEESTVTKNVEEKYKGRIDELKSRYGKQNIEFAINCTKKGEKSQQTGKMVTTNYYTYNFILDADGKVQGKE